MSLWVDKHRPKDLMKLEIHKQISTNLKNLVHKGDFPHLLVYGPSGAGKKTRVMCLLRELYGTGVERLRMENMNFTTPSNKKLSIATISSNYHIEVNPSDVGIYDRVVIMDLIKNVAQTQQLDSSGQREFKVVVLTEVDSLSKDAQHALRRTMEKYIANCRLILIGNSTSRVIPAIKSRCLGIRVPSPSTEEIVTILQNICKKEGLTIPQKLAENMATLSERNLRRAILLCEAAKVQQYPFNPDQKLSPPDWQSFIKSTTDMILLEQSPKMLFEVRSNLYELLTHGIPADIIFKGLYQNLAAGCDLTLKAELASTAAQYEYRMQQGNKHIFHLEAFVAKFMSMYKKFMDNTMAMGDDF
ncbi:replication factor C subunit 3 [Chrysoperla carnea]|uniref:replication factor C subunit 3 n=1 Tax=Chrysoperla carnea TaxID=189513 RepID=UPI001D0831B0|nr:replication factor C subunit 3 [Chrysoperla carnea]